MSLINKRIIKLFVACEMFCCIFILVQNIYTSDYFGLQVGVDNRTIIFLFVTIVFFYWAYYYLWEGCSRLLSTRKTFRPVGNINLIMLFLSIFYFVFILQTGIGKVSVENNSNNLTIIEKILYSPLILFKFNFLIYMYAAGNKFKNKMYYLVIFLFTATELIRGVSFSILLFVIIEHKIIAKLITKKNLIIAFPIILLCINAIYNIKYSVRLGYKYEYLNMYETSIMLIGRLSIISNMLYIQEHYNNIKLLLSSHDYSMFDEFFEKLTPMPSLFGINDKVIEFGKIIFSYSNGNFNSATASSVLVMMCFLPSQIFTIVSILFVSSIFIIFITNRLFNNLEQNTVAFFFVFLTLYQGFLGIIASYVYALFVYFLFIVIGYVLPKRKLSD